MDELDKQCTLCYAQKPVSDFYKYRNGRSYTACKVCHNRRTRERLDANPEQKAERNWRNRGIDITWVRFEQMDREQDSRCAICEKPCGSGRRLAVDHNHETGLVRGLLCLSCNQLVGKLENGTVPFHRLINYLRRDPSWARI